jgi:long-chain acyl-CoA synthetase
MFWNRVEKSAGSPAHKFKQQGAWKTLSWREVGNTVRELTAALVALGRRPGDAVGILSTSRAEWVQADFAIFSAGGMTIPIYPTYPPDLIEYIVNDAGVKTLIVEDPTQLAKVLEVDKSMPGLEHIVIMQGYEGREPSPRTFTWEALQRLGREKADSLKAELPKRVDGITRNDVATIVHTSGTTAPTHGGMQPQGNHISALESAAQTTSIS